MRVTASALKIHVIRCCTFVPIPRADKLSKRVRLAAAAAAAVDGQSGNYGIKNDRPNRDGGVGNGLDCVAGCDFSRNVTG